jgi:TPR repeat protein
MTATWKQFTVIPLLLWATIACGEQGLASEVLTLQDARLYAEAVRRLESIPKDDSSFAEAQRLLGDVHRQGKGASRNDEKAVEYYRTAARLGDADAMYELGAAYESGRGVAASASGAFHWYDAAALEHPMAALRYAEIVLANQGNSDIVARHDPIERLQFAADANVMKAKYLLAGLAMRGMAGDIDTETALALLEEASKDIAEANTLLGQIAHKNGNVDIAKPRFETALEKGDTSAAAYLGHYAEHGIGEAVDRRRAFEMYEKAKGVSWADEGRRRIATHYKSIELFGTRIYGVPREELRARFAGQGLTIVSQEGYFDAFDASSRLAGRGATVTVAYAPTPPAYVAEVTYQFSTEKRRDSLNLYREAEGKLREKYGEPTRNDRKDRTRFLHWTVGDARVVLSHKSSESKVHVTYQLNPYANELRQFVQKTEDRGDLSNAL